MIPKQRHGRNVHCKSIHRTNSISPPGMVLRYVSHRGGSKGPVILSHCIGVSSLMYATDTIKTNLLEYLYAREFDVWLLDYRFSIELPASRNQATMDDVATRDYPAAVSKVRQLAATDSVQVVAHGVGSSTFSMALLAGLSGGCGRQYVHRFPRILSCQPSTASKLSVVSHKWHC